MTVLHKNLTGTDLHEPKGVATATSNQVYTADGAGSGAWLAQIMNITGLSSLTAPAVDDSIPIYDLSATANKKISVLDLLESVSIFTALTAPAVDDLLFIYDLSTTTGKAITTVDLLETINVLTEDTSPDEAADFLLSYDTSAGTVKKVLPTNISAGTEDSWTPAMAIGGSTVGITYSTQVGRYIKIGNLVTVWGSLVLSNNGASTGAITITGLPFAASTVTGLEFSGAVGSYFNVSTGGQGLMIVVASGASVITLYLNEGDAGDDSITATQSGTTFFDDTSGISFTLTYRTG